MNLKAVILGTVAYTAVTFPIAVVWHVVLFEEKYRAFGYFEGEPNFMLGFLTILLQGMVLSFLFPFVKMSGSAVVKGLKFTTVIGVFFWTSHVLAILAKQTIDGAVTFAIMETFYLAIQFGIFGLLIGLIYKKSPDDSL